MMRLVDSVRLRVLNVLRSHVLLLFLVFTVLLASHLLQAFLWALAYYTVGGFDDLATSLYFSLSSYSTAGFADVALPPNLRLLGPLEAATGVLMFGWSTGYIFAFATRMMAAQQTQAAKSGTD
jgi:voltage-gated potassium channel